MAYHPRAWSPSLLNNLKGFCLGDNVKKLKLYKYNRPTAALSIFYRLFKEMGKMANIILFIVVIVLKRLKEDKENFTHLILVQWLHLSLAAVLS